jgi:hypothetical protein
MQENELKATVDKIYCIKHSLINWTIQKIFFVGSYDPRFSQYLFLRSMYNFCVDHIKGNDLLYNLSVCKLLNYLIVCLKAVFH